MPISLVDIAAGAIVPEVASKFKHMETLINLLIAALTALAASKGYAVWSTAKLTNEAKRHNLDVAKASNPKVLVHF